MSNNLKLLVAWSELLGGAVGLLVLLPITASQKLGLAPLYYVGAGTAFLLASVAGWLLLKNQKLGYKLSLLVQLLQVVQIVVSSWEFQYATGLQVLLRIDTTGFEFSPGVNAAVWLGPTLVPSPSMVAINLFALWASIFLARQLTTRRAQLALVASNSSDESQSASSAPSA